MVKKEYFDSFNDVTVFKYVLQNSRMSFAVLTFGGIVQNVLLHRDSGTLDVALGCNTISQYLSADCYLGAVVGRCSNRIERGEFILNGKQYRLDCNDHGNHLHGGVLGFNKQVFSSRVEGNTLKLFLASCDGDQCYPANLNFEVDYTLLGTTLQIEFFANADNDTVFSPTSHIYFNLNGEGSGNVLTHEMQINAQNYTPVNNRMIPTGEIVPTFASPFDFSVPKQIGCDIFKPDQQLIIARGYDHNYCVDGNPMAQVYCKESNVKMTLDSTFCGLQFYSGNQLDRVIGKSEYNEHDGFCLEPQCYPNAVNIPAFHSPVLKKGDNYYGKICYTFEF